MALPSAPALLPQEAPNPQSSLPVNHFSTVPRELLHVLSRFVPYEATLVARANRWLYSCYKTYPFVWLEWVRVIQSTPHGRKVFEDHKSDIVAWCPPLGKYIGGIKVADFGEEFEFSRDGSLVACQGNHHLCILETQKWHVVATLGIAQCHPVLRFSDSASLLMCMTWSE